MLRKYGAGVFALLLVVFWAGAVRAQAATKPSAPQKIQGKPAATSARESSSPSPPKELTVAQQEQEDDADREDPCPGSNNQHELNRCAARARDKADAELNKTYQQLMRETEGTERAKLRAAQLAWLKFRDAHCDYESIGNKGGSIYPMVFSFCLARVTTGRVKQLQEIISENSQP